MQTRKSGRLFLFLVLGICAALGWSATVALADTYAYDALGRLVRIDRTSGGSTTYQYDAADNRITVTRDTPPPPPTERSCNNSVCSGTNSILFTVKNATNAYETGPWLCAGSWTMNTSGSNYFSSCATGWVAVACGGRPNCPYSIPNPPRTFAGCVNSVCEGVNTVLGPVANAVGDSNGSARYLCTSRWQVNTSGSNWSSNCPTGWQLYS